jgi:putative transposase
MMLLSEQDQPAPMRLRRIEVWVEEKQDTLVFVSNHPKLAASTIAAVYKDRWRMELFFKALKQSLRIKTFIGRSENAVHIGVGPYFETTG